MPWVPVTLLETVAVGVDGLEFDAVESGFCSRTEGFFVKGLAEPDCLTGDAVDFVA